MIKRVKILLTILFAGVSSCYCQYNQDSVEVRKLSNQLDTLSYSNPISAGMSADKIEEGKNLFVEAVNNNKTMGYQMHVNKGTYNKQRILSEETINNATSPIIQIS